MTQKISPYIEAKYGWDFGEGGWNSGMDQNLLKFSFLFDRNVDGVVSSLPDAVNGKAYYLTADNRLYFAAGTNYFSTPVPKWFEFKDRLTGDTYQFDGVTANLITSPAQLDSRLDSIELTVTSLGTAAFEDISFFATQASLDIVEAGAQAYTDLLRQDLADDDEGKGVSLVRGAVRQINSVAELRTVEGRYAGEQVALVSYYDGWAATARGATGGGLLTWDASSTAPDDGGTVFAPSGITTGRWVRNGRRRNLKIEDWGAVPYDSTVDTGPIISAMSSYLTALGGGFITTDGGDFYLASSANLHSKVRLRGTGPGHTRFITTTNTIDAFITASDSRYLSIESATIASDAGIGASNAAIRNNATNGGSRHRYADLEINAFYYGHHCGDLWWDMYLEDVRWNSCQNSFYHIGTGGLNINNLFVKCYSNEPIALGMRFGPMKNTKLQSCNFGGHPTLTSSYVSILGNCYSLKFESCNFENAIFANDSAGVVVWSGSTVSFDSCTFVSNEPAGGATRAFEIQARDTSVVRVHGCSTIQPGVGMQSFYTLNTARLILGKNRDMDTLLDLSSNKAVKDEAIWRGSATGVKSGDLITTGKGATVSQFMAVQIPAADTYPTVMVSVDEKNSTGAVKLRFTNLSDGSPNTAGTFAIDWVAF